MSSIQRGDRPGEGLPALRWGFVGAGTIARKLADALEILPGEIELVGARSDERVRAFAAATGARRITTDPMSVVTDPDIDAVYVATPHSVHDPYVVAALDAGKHVLCEKPMTHSAQATRACADAARRSGGLLMEAMWTRFLPAMAVARRWIEDGRIGVLRGLTAHMGFAAPDDPAGRLMSPELAGGALLDIGVYPLALACDVLGDEVEALEVTSAPMSTGVDGFTSITLAHRGGLVASVSASLTAQMEGVAWIAGSEAGIRLPRFHRAEHVELVRFGEVIERESHPHLVNGLEHQLMAFLDAVGEGRSEHPLMPLSHTIAVADWSQAVRDRIGLRYPFEEEG